MLNTGKLPCILFLAHLSQRLIGELIGYSWSCGNVRYNTHLYCLAVQAGFYSEAVECLTATQEIPVRSLAGTKGV